MIVRCIYEEVNDEVIENFKLNKDIQKFRYSLTKGKEYIVLGISYSPSFLPDSQWPRIYIKDDSGYLYSHPLFLFEIIDDRVSKYWHINFSKDTHWLSFEPKSWIENEFYHDDLSNDFPEVLEDFNKLYKLMYDEFSDIMLTSDIKAIPIEKPWVQCPQCAEAFEAIEHKKHIICPKCTTTLINPYQ